MNNLAQDVQDNQAIDNVLGVQQEEAPPLIPIQPQPVQVMIFNPVAPMVELAPEVEQDVQVLAMDELTDTDSDIEQQPHVHLPIPQVEIAPFPDFENLHPMIPLPEYEVQIEDLLGFEGNNLHGQEPFAQDIQLGMVQIVQPAFDPIFGNLSPLKPSPEAFRLWVNFFSQHSLKSKPIFIPDNWMNFITFLLMQTPTFDWAKSFLNSKA